MANDAEVAESPSPQPNIRGEEEEEAKAREDFNTTDVDVPLSSPHSHPAFLEVACKSSGKVMRFAFGTKAGFAIYLINQKNGSRVPPALLIESVKEGEEPISFGPSAFLVNYGEDWKLQTVVELDGGNAKLREKNFSQSLKSKEFSPDVHPSKNTLEICTGSFSCLYLGKVLAVFVFMFVFAGIFTLLLGNLPEIISYITSSSI